MRKSLFLLFGMILLICLTPMSASANSATFFDVDNDVSYSIELHSKTAEIGGEISYTTAIKNNSSYEVNVIYIADNLDNLFFAYDEENATFWLNEEDTRLLPGEIFGFDLSGTVSDTCDWYMENGKVYLDIKLYLWFETDRESVKEEGAWAHSIYHNKATIAITNIKDGSEFISLDIYGSYNEMVFYDEGVNLNHRLNSSKTNIDGFAVLPISITNKSNHRLDDIRIFSRLMGEHLKVVSLESEESLFEMVYDYQRIDPVKMRPKRSEAYANVLFKLDGEYYGAQATTVCRNIFIDQKPEMKITVERLPKEQQTEEEGMDSYNVTLKNVSKHPIQNMYIDLCREASYKTKGTFENTTIIYSFEINDVVSRDFVAPESGRIEIEVGSIAFGDKVESLSYRYNADSETGEIWSSYPYMYFYYDYDKERVAHFVVDSIGGDLPAQFENYLEILHEEEAPAESVPPKPSASLRQETEEPAPIPTARIIYVTKKPAIPSWVWPVLGVVIVLVGGVLMWLRQKQDKEDDVNRDED